jgi:hypothetical protein
MTADGINFSRLGRAEIHDPGEEGSDVPKRKGREKSDVHCLAVRRMSLSTVRSTQNQRAISTGTYRYRQYEPGKEPRFCVAWTFLL